MLMIENFLVWAWKNIQKLLLWTSWIIVTVVLTFYFTNSLTGEDKSTFLPAETTHGHYQIELVCDACHTTTFDGVKQEACLECHAKELELGDDSHPPSKFNDPRNASLLQVIDAQKCITCHVEHRPDMTRKIGVTLPPDYCVYCHEDVAEDRPTHEGMPFDTCRGACHNYHDNTALYEDFLTKNLHHPDTFGQPVTIGRNFLEIYQSKPKYPIKHLTMTEHDAPENVDLEAGMDWAETSHAKAGVNCMGCHGVEEYGTWVDKPSHKACEDCHEHEVGGFLTGRHGMRLAENLSPMTTDMARLPMKKEVHKALTCVACHQAHDFSTEPRHTAVDACLGCHADDHSRAYKASSHFRLWNEELRGQMPKGSGVSCATCHLPREVVLEKGVKRTVVQHNQNLNLRPAQKMIRTVCMNCHGLGFSMDALADEELMRNNFSERPSKHIESLEMAESRIKKKPASQTMDSQKPEPVSQTMDSPENGESVATVSDTFGHPISPQPKKVEIPVTQEPESVEKATIQKIQVPVVQMLDKTKLVEKSKIPVSPEQETPVNSLGHPSTIMEELIDILGEIVDKTENSMAVEK